MADDYLIHSSTRSYLVEKRSHLAIQKSNKPTERVPGDSLPVNANPEQEGIQIEVSGNMVRLSRANEAYRWLKSAQRGDRNTK